jgi:hypothetical protein
MASSHGRPGVDYPVPGQPVVKCRLVYARKNPRKYSLSDLKRIVRYLLGQNIDPSLIFMAIADALGLADRICRVGKAIDAVFALRRTFAKLLLVSVAITTLRTVLTFLLERPILRLASWLTAILVLALILVIYLDKAINNLRLILDESEDLEWLLDLLVDACEWLESAKGAKFEWLRERAKEVNEGFDDILNDLDIPGYQNFDDVTTPIEDEAESPE